MIGLLAASAAHPLAHLNAALNALSLVLLLVAWRQAKQRRFAAHGRTMLAALATSTVFLVSYLTYHALVGSVKFTHPGPIRVIYLTLLLTHVVLAATVPLLAIASAWLGAGALGWRGPADDGAEVRRERLRQAHRRLVRWAFPIWLYVSATGIVVYVMLYHLWPPTGP